MSDQLNKSASLFCTTMGEMIVVENLPAEEYKVLVRFRFLEVTLSLLQE